MVSEISDPDKFPGFHKLLFHLAILAFLAIFLAGAPQAFFAGASAQDFTLCCFGADHSSPHGGGSA